MESLISYSDALAGNISSKTWIIFRREEGADLAFDALFAG
jgi:hypothetical protein